MTTREDKFGGTLEIDGPVAYQGGRDELQLKLRARDDEIDRLRNEITELKSNMKFLEDAMKEESERASNLSWQLNQDRQGGL